MSLSCIKRFSTSEVLLRVAIAITVGGVIASLPIYAQTTPAPAASTSVADAPTHRSFFHRKNKAEDFANSQKIDAKVTGGVLTVDGFVAKVELNYDIHHAKYMYFFAPGVGTVVVSRVEVPGAIKVKDAIHGSSVDFAIGGHSFSLENDATVASMAVIIDNPTISVKKEKEREIHDAWITLDENAQALFRTPQVGYGQTNVAPYVFPLSDAQPKDNYAHFVPPPPMPTNILPRTHATQSGGTGGK